MPRSFFAMLVLGVIVAAGVTVGVAVLAGFEASGGGGWVGGAALLVLLLLILRLVAGRRGRDGRS